MSTHRPESRTEFKEFILRGLGAPIIQINVTDEQIEDCIEVGLSHYIDYHYDGTMPTYLRHEITADTITNKYITIPDTIIGIKRILPLGSTFSGNSNMFSPEYQLALSQIQDMSTFSLIPYYMMRQQYSFIEQMIIGKPLIRYNRHFDKLYLDVDVKRLVLGQYLIIECYTAIDPETETDVWNDRILQKHVKSLVKVVWGSVLGKYEGVQLAGGITMNGRQIYDDGVGEVQAIEDEYRDAYTLPPEDLVL